MTFVARTLPGIHFRSWGYYSRLSWPGHFQEYTFGSGGAIPRLWWPGFCGLAPHRASRPGQDKQTRWLETRQASANSYITHPQHRESSFVLRQRQSSRWCLRHLRRSRRHSSAVCSPFQSSASQQVAATAFLAKRRTLTSVLSVPMTPSVSLGRSQQLLQQGQLQSRQSLQQGRLESQQSHEQGFPSPKPPTQPPQPSPKPHVFDDDD